MPKLLLVEDETDLREAMAEEIAEEGYDIQVAHNGLKALEQLANYTPDIILSDINMPEMDGFQLLEAVRASHTHLDDVPFLFLSAFNAKEDVIKGKKLGADDYLVKPVDFELLFATLESRLTQVQRMTDRKEKQFVKLYHTLHSEQHKNGQENTDTQESQSEDPDKVRVFGRCVHYENLVSIFNRFNQNKLHNLDEFIKTSIESVVPSGTKLDSSFHGIIFMYGIDPSKKISLENGLHLEQVIQKKLFENEIGQTITSNFGKLVLGKDLRIRDLPFDVHLHKDSCNDDTEKSKALVQRLKTKFSDKGFLQEKTKDVLQHSSLSESKFMKANEKIPEMRFFYFDAASEDFLQSTIAFCGMGDQKAIDYMADMRFLELISGKLSDQDGEAAIVIDVHYDTLAKPERLAQYRTRYEKALADTDSRIFLNVRGIPHNIDLGKCASTVTGCKIKNTGWIAQFNPWLDTGLEVDQLKVSCMVWGMKDIYGTQASLDHYKKQKAAYKLCGSSLILRDVSANVDASEFKNFHFDGFAKNQK